eukprot:415429_1
MTLLQFCFHKKIFKNKYTCLHIINVFGRNLSLWRIQIFIANFDYSVIVCMLFLFAVWTFCFVFVLLLERSNNDICCVLGGKYLCSFHPKTRKPVNIHNGLGRYIACRTAKRQCLV